MRQTGPRRHITGAHKESKNQSYHLSCKTAQAFLKKITTPTDCGSALQIMRISDEQSFPIETSVLIKDILEEIGTVYSNGFIPHLKGNLK